jgi:hypothetical protein
MWKGDVASGFECGVARAWLGNACYLLRIHATVQFFQTGAGKSHCPMLILQGWMWGIRLMRMVVLLTHSQGIKS